MIPCEVIMAFNEEGKAFPIKFRYYSREDVAYRSIKVDKVYYYEIEKGKERYRISSSLGNHILERGTKSNFWFIKGEVN